ncbi:MAG TPA: 2-amino-4-hydroxy-6-hydroxymethyldihydropteridine diphosphokinase [Paludibacter sp.]|nr:2-amino-4-hydroxy-6-hydroxymethyldihydropteridine diphosphokinase [Paludibacter sp.]
MHQIYLGLGTNLGDKNKNLDAAIKALSHTIGKVVKVSSYHASEPWGFESMHSFLNAAACIESEFSPEEVLQLVKRIEKEAGRKRKSGNGYEDRPIDIDILFYDDVIIDLPELKIPHPHIADRDFVLTPLSEIAPDLVHPVLKRKIKDLPKP